MRDNSPLFESHDNTETLHFIGHAASRRTILVAYKVKAGPGFTGSRKEGSFWRRRPSNRPQFIYRERYIWTPMPSMQKHKGCLENGGWSDAKPSSPASLQSSLLKIRPERTEKEGLPYHYYGLRFRRGTLRPVPGKKT